MPKEKILPPGTTDVFQAVIGWTRDRDVQVGVAHVDGVSLFWQLVVGQLADIGEEKALTRRLAELGARIREDLGLGTDIPPEIREKDPGLLRHDADLASGVLNLLDVFAHAPSSVWADLDRQGCNDLIRQTRRARDAAFGRDE